MKARELNKRIEKFNKELYLTIPPTVAEFVKYLDEYAQPEFIRLYHEDKTMKSLTKRSILIMFRLNLKYRFIPFDKFGMYIKLNNN